MTTKGARIKSTTNTAPSAVVKKTDSVEPYHCKGKFIEDFEALCRQAQINFIVPVVQRPKPPIPSSNSTVTSDNKDKTTAKPTKNPPSKDRDVPGQQQHIENENGEISSDDPQPKTYSLKENQEYFRPKIQVEMESLEKQDTLTEILIRAWKIDRSILEIFSQTFPTLERLHTLHFWHTGLTDETLKILVSILTKCSNIRTLILDANPLTFESYDVLLTDDSLPIVNLSLRHCRITERGAALIGQGLGNERRQNKKIQTLNLAYNSIGDRGAEHIASSLKFNRTLLVLNLSSNDISDIGAEKIAEVLNKFPLTSEELVYRRQLLLQSTNSENPSNIHSARKGFDRRTSMNSSPTAAGRKKSGLATAKGKTVAAAAGGKSDGKETTKAPKKDDKPPKKGATIAETKSTKTAGKQPGEKGGKGPTNTKPFSTVGGNRSATLSDVESEEKTQIGEGIPLLDQNAELINDDLVLPGNKCLLSLNLSKNRITETGVQHFLRAIQYQELFIKLNISTRNASSISTTQIPSQGLLRLELQRNDFDIGTNEIHEKVQNLLTKRREPIFKNKDNQDDGSTGGRDTVGTPHPKSRTGMRH